MRRAIELECGGQGLRAAVVDPAVRARVVRRFDGAAAFYTRHRWVTSVRTAIRLADPAAETVLESLSRAAMVEHGLPVPRCGAPITGDDGRVYWVDFWWPEFGVVGEADGLGKYDDVKVVVAEKRRQEAIEGRGLTVVRWGMAEVQPSPAVMLARVRAALAHAPRRRA